MVAHKPLEFLYERFTKYIEERRREPREDVMTGLATATFPDGSLPEVDEVMRAGELVPDATMAQLFLGRLSRPDAAGGAILESTDDGATWHERHRDH